MKQEWFLIFVNEQFDSFVPKKGLSQALKSITELFSQEAEGLNINAVKISLSAKEAEDLFNELDADGSH